MMRTLVTKGTTKVTETLMTERTLVMEGKTLVTKVRPWGPYRVYLGNQREGLEDQTKGKTFGKLFATIGKTLVTKRK